MTIQEVVESSVNGELESGVGYCLDFRFTKEETQDLIEFIHQQWLDRIKKVCPVHWKEFSEIGIARYHELAHLLDHGSTWIKKYRIFSKEIAEKIRKMSLISSLESAF